MSRRQRWHIGNRCGPLRWGALTNNRGYERYRDDCGEDAGSGVKYVVPAGDSPNGHWVVRGSDERGFPTWTVRPSPPADLTNERDKMVHSMYLNDMGHAPADWEPELQPGEKVQRRCMGILTDAEWDGMLRIRRDKDGNVIPGSSVQTKASGPSGFQTKVIRILPEPHQRMLRHIIDLSLLQCMHVSGSTSCRGLQGQ